MIETALTALIDLTATDSSGINQNTIPNTFEQSNSLAAEADP